MRRFSRMTITIRDLNKFCIVDIEENSMSKEILSDLKRVIEKFSHRKKIAFNLMNTDSVNNDFIEFIENIPERISLFNLSISSYVLFFILKLDKTTDLYVSEEDFLSNYGRIVNRQLKLCT